MKREKNKLQSLVIGYLQQYNPADIKKGIRLFENFDVSLEDHYENTNTYLSFVSSESQIRLEYLVQITLSANAVDASCQCPAFEKAIGCKHIAATLMEILFQETDLDKSHIKALALKKQPSRTPAASTGKEISIFDRHEGPEAWKSIAAEPHQAFAEVTGNGIT